MMAEHFNNPWCDGEAAGHDGDRLKVERSFNDGGAFQQPVV